MMYLWRLKRLTDIQYDEYEEFIIAAQSATEARVIAGSNCGDEGSTVWASETYSSCSRLNPRQMTVPKVIMSSFNAG